jgi:hypothetical protein
MISIWMLWVQCTTSTKCKSIRIVESLVMDGWNGHCLAQCWFCFKKVFRKEKKLDGVLVGYCHDDGINGWGTRRVLSGC